MKPRKYITLFLIFISSICVAKNPNYKINVISISYLYGDGSNNIYIGSSNKKIDSVKDIQAVPSHGIGKKPQGKSFILSKPCLEYLYTYIEKECINQDSPDKTKFVILSYQGKNVIRCSYQEKQLTVKYFEGMIDWINQSNEKNEYQSLIMSLNKFITYFKD